MAERVFAYRGVMQALMRHELEQQEAAEGGGDGRRATGGGRGGAESPRRDLADRTIIPLTPEMVASGVIPGMGPAEQGLIEHAQV